MTDEFDSKVVVITGAASGQGRAGALLFARAGAKLALCDIDDRGLEETVKHLENEGLGADVLARKVDLCALDEVEKFAAEVTAAFGVVDVLYNNAGIIHLSSIERMTSDDWDRIHTINVKGPFFLVQHLLPALRRSHYGSIINISSGSGLVAPQAEMTAYSSSKGAMIALTRALAQDLGPDRIRVNCIAPGLIDTPMSRGLFAQIPVEEREAAIAHSLTRGLSKRTAAPEEVAAVAVFLASPGASFINGAIIPVDDGYTAV